MNVIALTLTTLGLAALAQAKVDYTLRCTKREVGIRWPSYSSNSEYYVCDGVGGKQLTINCNTGDVFTFVLQMCASPSRFIPAPPLDILPLSTHSAMQLSQMPLPIEIMQSVQNPLLPKPLYPSNVPNLNFMQPPVNMEQRPPTLWEMPIAAPPHVNELDHHLVAPMETVDLQQPPNAPDAENLPPLSGQVKPVMPSLPAKPVNKPQAPMPPTPAPTPPAIPSKKQPAVPSKKKAPVPTKKAPQPTEKKGVSVPSKKAKKPVPPKA